MIQHIVLKNQTSTHLYTNSQMIKTGKQVEANGSPPIFDYHLTYHQKEQQSFHTLINFPLLL